MIDTVDIKRGGIRSIPVIKPVSVLLMLFIVLSTDSMIIATNSNTSLLKTAQYTIIGITVLLFSILAVRKHVFEKDFLFLICVCATIFLTMVFNSDITGGYALKAVILLFGYFFCALYGHERFIAYYISVMRIIAIVSLIGYLLSDIIIRETNFFPIVTNTSGMEFTTLFLTNIPHSYYLLPRNFGPFWEPGVYQAYLYVALFFVLFCRKNVKVFDTVLFSLTMVSTLSTTGIFVLAIIFIGYIVNKRKDNGSMIKCVIVSLSVLVGLYVALNSEITSALFSKFVVKDSSFVTRWSGIEVNIRGFLQAPVFGLGITGMAEYQNMFWSSLHNPWGSLYNVNTILNHFSVYGVSLGIFFFAMLYRLVRDNIRNFMSCMVVFVGFVLIYSSENYMYSLFFNLIVFLRPQRMGLQKTWITTQGMRAGSTEDVPT